MLVRNDIEVVFDSLPAFPVRVRVLDEGGRPSIAGFIIRDDQDQIYPNISKRLAPDFFFQPQVYRQDGDTIPLPPGSHTIAACGPENISQTRSLKVAGPQEISFKLDRWIDPSWTAGIPATTTFVGRLFAL